MTSKKKQIVEPVWGDRSEQSGLRSSSPASHWSSARRKQQCRPTAGRNKHRTATSPLLTYKTGEMKYRNRIGLYANICTKELKQKMKTCQSKWMCIRSLTWTRAGNTRVSQVQLYWLTFKNQMSKYLSGKLALWCCFKVDGRQVNTDVHLHDASTCCTNTSLSHTDQTSMFCVTLSNLTEGVCTSMDIKSHWKWCANMCTRICVCLNMSACITCTRAGL